MYMYITAVRREHSDIKTKLACTVAAWGPENVKNINFLVPRNFLCLKPYLKSPEAMLKLWR